VEGALNVSGFFLPLVLHLVLLLEEGTYNEKENQENPKNLRGHKGKIRCQKNHH